MENRLNKRIQIKEDEINRIQNKINKLQEEQRQYLDEVTYLTRQRNALRVIGGQR